MFYYLYPYTEFYRAIYRIVINTKAHTLTLFRDNNVYKTYKVAVGKPSTPTPKGTFKIINRAINPGGPFGARWLGLNIPYGDYGIHGTNNPSSIGKSISNGCIRMFNNQVIELSNLVPIGTTVTIV
ncbi:ErfK/YbiS/YcfS/YnhG family protein [Clostridium botulinum B str. Osaka05]|uniref:ErfK/YbiS/YcfS/YnhG family protein n=1 Tax=Clostridium botulinum B str. Osaka05 TaxID=1407017 RepID=A0A0S6U2X6_CLOBO|nr:L,D-transpeptidase [Clostridium botulinum]GAE01386.1 ErfK/YbiS/YcfS/YnhG family protein [Clostridium botulinum B str. Osaka05]